MPKFLAKKGPAKKFQIRNVWANRLGECILTLLTFFFYSSANCRSPLGMESGAIPDSALMAFSTFERDFEKYGPKRGRLHLRKPSPGYRAGNVKANQSWIMVELGKETVVTGIATQGYGDTAMEEWVTKYTLMFSTGSVFLHFKETSGEIKVRE